MTLPSKALLKRWLTVSLVAAVVFAPRWDVFGAPQDEKQDQLTTRMLTPTFDEAVNNGTKMVGSGPKWSPLESHKNLPRLSSMVAASLLLFLAWTSCGSVHPRQMIRLRRACRGRLGSRSPPHLQLA